MPTSAMTQAFSVFFVFFAQVWLEPSTSRSRSVSGTASASRAGIAPCPWWAEASSPSVTTSCALTADARSDQLCAMSHRAHVYEWEVVKRRTKCL